MTALPVGEFVVRVRQELTLAHDDTSEARRCLNVPVEEHSDPERIQLLRNSAPNGEVVGAFATLRCRCAEHRMFVDDDVVRTGGVLKGHFNDPGLRVIIDPAVRVHLEFGHQTQSPIDVQRPKTAPEVE